MIYFYSAFLLCLMIGSPLHAVTPVALESLITQARAKNPELQAARQRWKVLEAEKTSAGAWPNPTFTYINERDPSRMEGVQPDKIQHYNLQQSIPFPGKLTRDAQMKKHEARIARTAYQALELDVLSRVKERAYQLYLTDRSIELADQSVAVLKSVLRSAQARLSSAQTSAVDAFMAQAELRRMENVAFEQRQTRQLVQIELNTLLGEPTTTVREAVAPPPLADIPHTLEMLLETAMVRSPQVQTGHHEQAHSAAMTRRSRLDYAPDFGVILERQTAEVGPAGRQIGVSLSFPLWIQRPWGNVRAANEHEIETKAMAVNMANMVQRMVHMEYVETQTHLGKARMSRDGIIPAAESTLSVVRQQYASGQADILKFLEAFRGWISAQMEYQEELYHYGEHWSELNRWVGSESTGDSHE